MMPDNLGDTGNIVHFVGEQKTGEPIGPGPIRVLSADEWVAEHAPLSYLVDGICLEGYFYSITGRTGHLKTSVALELARCIAFDAPFCGHAIGRPGRVLYLCGENDVDTRMRYLAMSAHWRFDPMAAPFDVVGMTFNINDELPMLQQRAESVGGYVCTFVDTSPAYFVGADMNDNGQQRDHARMQRRLCGLKGHPTVVTLCHPVKNAGKDNLLPYGGGAFLNELDGNLTLWTADRDVFTLHWQGKFRGPEFSPLTFGIELVNHPLNVDSKGKQIPSVVAVPITEARAEELERARLSEENLVLQALTEKPQPSVAQVASRAGFFLSNGKPYKAKADRLLRSLKKEELVTQKRGKWIITKSGMNEISS